ncbi:hypothetical protein DRN67_02490 [Candidatus Micrarchaeota archaeon]|nr:MAG: hypothetical protein DRN67_02490 [Candidatus Micrarchaeota archaeon]
MRRGLDVFVGVVSDEKAPTAEVAARIMQVKGVERVYELTGNFDIMVQASSDSASALNGVIENIRACEGVVSSTTYLVLEAHENR